MTAPGPLPAADRRRLLVLVGAALLLQLLILAAHDQGGMRPLVADEIRYHERALALSRGELVRPTFLWPPLQEAFLAGLYRLFGDAPAAERVVQGLLLLAAALLLRRLLLAAGASRVGADVGAALLLLDPQVAAFAQYLWPEVPHLFLFLSAAALLLLGEPRPGRLLAAGGCLGLALLAKSLLFPFVLPLAVVAAARGSGLPGRRRLLAAAAFLSGVALLLAPVSALHRARWGTWRIADSAAFNVLVGLEDPPSRTDWDSVPSRELAWWEASGATPEERDRATWARIRRKLDSEGVATVLSSQLRKQYVRLLDSSSFFTDQLPGGRWAGDRSPTPLTRGLRAWASFAHGAGLALLAAGVAAYPWRERWRQALLPALLLAYAAGLFLVLHVKTRYRVPLFPALAFFAAFAVTFASRSRRWPRLAVALAAGAGLVAVAFDLP